MKRFPNYRLTPLEKHHHVKKCSRLINNTTQFTGKWLHSVSFAYTEKINYLYLVKSHDKDVLRTWMIYVFWKFNWTKILQSFSLICEVFLRLGKGKCPSPLQDWKQTSSPNLLTFFLYLFFFSWRFRIQRTAGEWGCCVFHSSVPLPPALETLRHISRESTAENSPLHIASNRTRTDNLWFLSVSR